MTESVSVIIPLYNKATYVRRAITSVLRQSCQPAEIIVVDDGSTDNGVDVVIRLGDPRIRVLTQENLGPGAARNAGIREAKSNVVAFLDADDEWLPDYLKRGLGFLEKNSDAASVSQGYYDGATGLSTRSMWETRGLREAAYALDANADPHLAIAILAYMSPWSTMARKSVVLKYGGYFDGYRCLYAEDAFLWLKVLLNEKIGVLMDPQVVYHTEDSGLAYSKNHPHPIEPFLLDPSRIEESCPVNKRDLLRKMLAIRALQTAQLYAKYGEARIARDLLDRFGLPHFMVSAALKTRLYCEIAFALPMLRSVYRMMRTRVTLRRRQSSCS